jgi:1-phosphatidylinositol phosphodiesterase
MKNLKNTILNYSLKPYSILFSLMLLFLSCTNQEIVDTTNSNISTSVSSTKQLSTLSSKKMITSSNWMAFLADDLDIRAVSIPATHDSGTNGLMRLAKCQDLSISAQLNAGIRFLDIRVTPQGTGSISNFSFNVSHTFVSSIGFKDVLDDVKIFLTANPFETVLIKIARDSGADYDLPDNRKENMSFYNEFANYKSAIKIENFLTQFLIAQDINNGYAAMFTQ